MADIDLKTETPDTTLPSTGFLFGADSQSAASPSVYSTQAVATALLGSTSLTGATVTADSPVINAAQTWNAGATTFTAVKMNVTDTASASGSLLMDLQVGGTSIFAVRRASFSGTKYNRAVVVLPQYSYSSIQTGGFFTIGVDESTPNIALNSASGGGIDFVAGSPLRWRDSATNATGGVADLILTRRGTANLRLGAADAAAPVAQTLSVQSVVAGTTNTAGANLTITGSQGTGTGAGGSIVFQVAPAGSSGTAQNALADALTINSARQLIVGAGATATPSFCFSADTSTGIFSFGTGNISFSTSGTERFRMGSGGRFFASDGISFGQTSAVPFSTMSSSGYGTISFAPVSGSSTILQIGGTTSSFPAIKRSSTTLQARLADDSAFAPVQGKLTTDTAYAAGDPTTTGYLVVYDSTGTAYKIPAVAV